MFSIRIRVACSALSMRTVSASARAFSASALASRTVERKVASFTKLASSEPPSTMFITSPSSIPPVF